MSMQKKALLVAAAAALAGILLAGHSTYRHFRIQLEGVAEESYCSINEKIDCDVVNASSYSEVLGVPIAWWGIIFYLLVGGLALYARRSPDERRSAAAFAWLLSLGSLPYCAFLAYVTVFVLKAVCLECIGMYVVSLAFAASLYPPLGRPWGEAHVFLRDYALAALGAPSRLGFSPALPKYILLAALAYLSGWGAMAAAQHKLGPKQQTSVEDKLLEFGKEPVARIAVDPAWPAWGNPKARVTLVEFSEFQCPFCRMSAFQVRPYLQEFKDDVRFYFVSFPLDVSCNPAVQATAHPMACAAAKAGVCAQQRGDFWSFHDELFRKQAKLAPSLLLDLAAARGWDKDAFLACIESPETLARVQKDVSAGAALGITGTPALYLDGRRLRKWKDPEFIRKALRQEIAAAGRRARILQ